MPDLPPNASKSLSWANLLAANAICSCISVPVRRGDSWESLFDLVHAILSVLLEPDWLEPERTVSILLCLDLVDGIGFGVDELGSGSVTCDDTLDFVVARTVNAGFAVRPDDDRDSGFSERELRTGEEGDGGPWGMDQRDVLDFFPKKGILNRVFLFLVDEVEGGGGGDVEVWVMEEGATRVLIGLGDVGEESAYDLPDLVTVRSVYEEDGEGSGEAKHGNGYSDESASGEVGGELHSV
ncbi:hypothetical protein EV421DRAFT_1738863 [Armillaria borealis]|uniref:Uncharacterized protein n=1 Tax=Armillaria borealis TaxID=47425 RepID=A0AA39MLA6_9AGAR|nr:hypothetical protein EV421DRAFT_1738863 [Armillaria borealis]